MLSPVNVEREWQQYKGREEEGCQRGGEHLYILQRYWGRGRCEGEYKCQKCHVVKSIVMSEEERFRYQDKLHVVMFEPIRSLVPRISS